MRRGAIFTLCMVIALGLLIHARSVRAFPHFSATDEAIIFNYADTWKATGRVAISLMPSPILTVTGNLYVYAAAVWAELFPSDAFALRYFSALGGLVLVVVVLLVGRELDDLLTGLLAAALLTANLMWLAVAHVGRQEIWLAVFVWAAVGLSLVSTRRNSAALALAGGMVAALSTDIHPLGVYACVALGAWWLAQQRPRRLLLAFVAGGLTGTAYYLLAHVLPEPAAFASAIRSELTSYGAEGWNPVEAMVARHLNYVRSNPLEAIVLLICSVWALRQRIGHGIGVFLGVLILLYTLTVADPNSYYPILWVTGMVILAALCLRRASTRWRMLLVFGFGIAFIHNAGLVERFVSSDWNARALDAMQQVAAHVPDEGRGVGESFLYLALRDNMPAQNQSLIGFTYVYFEALRSGLSYGEIIEALAPDWIITMTDETPFTPEMSAMSVEMPHMRLPLPAELLAQRYGLANTFPTELGKFEIWLRG